MSANARPESASRIVALSDFLLVLGLGCWVVWNAEQRRIDERRADTALLAANHAAAIQRSVENALSSTYALAALIRRGNGQIADFSSRPAG